ncbi:MAG: hypothetical protein C0518_12470 [Opitutus sp.]|nr:hypothetical protein [Opitutus sp.]
MKSSLPRYFLAGALALAFGFTAALAQESDAKKEKGPSKADLAKYDANQDGTLDEAESAAMKVDKDAKKEANRAAQLEKYDTNKDGKIDQTEREVEKADKEKAKAEKQAAAEAKKAEKEAKKAEKAAKQS